MTGGGSLAILNGQVLRSASAVPEALDIIVRDGLIDALLAPGSDLPADLPVLDAARGLVIPGLVNAHYHSHDVLLRGSFEDLPLEAWFALAIMPGRRVGAREVRLRTLLGALENLRNGTTCVQDMLGCAPGAEPMVEAALAAYEEAGIRCVMSLQVGNRPAIDCVPGILEIMPAEHQPLISAPSAPVEDILSFVRAPLNAEPPARLHWAIAPGSPQRCTLDLMAGLGEIAKGLGLPFVTHVNESKLQVFLARDLYARHGGSVLDFLEAAGAFDERLVMAHGIWFDEAEIERIGASGATVATNPVSNLRLKSGIAPHRALRAAGVPLALGCDNVSAGDTQNMFEAMRLLANLNTGRGPEPSALSARDVLHIATQGGADAIGVGSLAGSIEVGRRADLAVLDLADIAYLPLNDAPRQIVHAEGGRGVRDVVVDGRIVIRDRAFATVDAGALADEAMDLAAEMQCDFRDHFERMAPAAHYLAEAARRQAARPLSYTRWAAAGDEGITVQ